MKIGRFKFADDNKIMSALDQMRQEKAPTAIDGEKVLKYSQGAYDGGNALRSTWKMGSLFLTEKKLAFFQGNNRLFEITLDCLNGTEIIDRNWIPGKVVKQLCVIKKWGDRNRKFYLSVKRAEEWKEAIETCPK